MGSAGRNDEFPHDVEHNAALGRDELHSSIAEEVLDDLLVDHGDPLDHLSRLRHAPNYTLVRIFAKLLPDGADSRRALRNVEAYQSRRFHEVPDGIPDFLPLRRRLGSDTVGSVDV